jgi:hypothetical protein
MIEVKIFLGNRTIESNDELKFEIIFTAFQGIIFIVKYLAKFIILF